MPIILPALYVARSLLPTVPDMHLLSVLYFCSPLTLTKIHDVLLRAPVSEFAPSAARVTQVGAARALRHPCLARSPGEWQTTGDCWGWGGSLGHRWGPIVGNAAGSLSQGVRPLPPLVARTQPTSPPAPLQGRCVPLRSTPLPVPRRRDGLVTALSSHEGWGTAQRGEGSRCDLDRGWRFRERNGLGHADFTQRHTLPAARYVQPQRRVSRSGPSLVVCGAALARAVLDLAPLHPRIFVKPVAGLTKLPHDTSLAAL
jgi:hypothetical protein